jgi:alpha-N-arabinofuranosidase
MKGRFFHFAVAVVLALSPRHAGAREFHVSPSGSDANPGGPAAMLKTIGEAARRAQPGDTVTVHAGVYREWVDPLRGGVSEVKRITYQAAPGEKVVITGSEIVTNWVHVTNDTWKVELPNLRSPEWELKN